MRRFIFSVCLAPSVLLPSSVMLGGAAAGSLLLSGCGRVGSIRPPEATAPAPVKSFSAEGKVNGVQLTWQAPTEDATGGNLKSLDKFLIQRSDYVKGGLPDFSTIAEVAPSVDAAAKAEKPEEGSEAAKAEQKKKPDNSFGVQTNQKQKLSAPLIYLDNTAQLGRRYDYRVLGVTESGVKGSADLLLRVMFTGETSRVENVAVTLTKKSK